MQKLGKTNIWKLICPLSHSIMVWLRRDEGWGSSFNFHSLTQDNKRFIEKHLIFSNLSMIFYDMESIFIHYTIVFRVWEGWVNEKVKYKYASFVLSCPKILFIPACLCLIFSFLSVWYPVWQYADDKSQHTNYLPFFSFQLFEEKR
jgi:hypothetical protein